MGYLAAGQSYKSLIYQFRIHKTTISKIIQVVYTVIYKVLQTIYIRFLSSAGGWLETAEKIYQHYNYRHCFDTADGRHIVKPKYSVSNFCNYKVSYSVVLIALVDCNYKFLAIDVGFQGTMSNRGVFKKSAMHHAMENNPLTTPPPPLHPSPHLLLLLNDAFYNAEEHKHLPFLIVGNDTFQL